MDRAAISSLRIAHVPEHMKFLSVDGEPVMVPEVAFKNTAWLSSAGGKTVRILTEFLEPQQRFEACGVKHAILFFGSARAKSHAEHARAVARAEAALEDPSSSPAERLKQQEVLTRLARGKWMCDVYDRIDLLAQKLTLWSAGRRGPDGIMPYIVSTGGGPGLMEAANKGAASVPGSLTAGIAISLPHEAGLNKFCSPELSFQHHYFFSRKYALCAPSRALIACPGGYGTFDELFEVLTLLQSGKIPAADTMPVVLFGEVFWRRVVDFDFLIEAGVISELDKARLFFTDDVDAAFDHITKKLLEWEVIDARETAKAARTATLAAQRAFSTAHWRARSVTEELDALGGASPGVIGQTPISHLTGIESPTNLPHVNDRRSSVPGT